LIQGNEMTDSSREFQEFTGERFVPTLKGPIRYEHLHRYAAVHKLVIGKRVLDAACGEGYGSAILSKDASHVSGVDISESAIKRANSRYAKLNRNLEFFYASVTCLPFEDCSFDVVVSFETLEHLSEQREMLAEFKRCLKPDGILVISTPDRENYRKAYIEKNEFHVKELDAREFQDILAQFFCETKIYWQRLATVSLLVEQESNFRSADFLSIDSETGVIRSDSSLWNPVYLIAICSNSKLTPVDQSVFFDKHDDIWNEQESKLKWASQLHIEFEKSQDWAKSLDKDIGILNRQKVQLENSLEDAVNEKLSQIATARLAFEKMATEKSAEIASLQARLDEQVHRVELQGDQMESLSRSASALGARLEAKQQEVLQLQWNQTQLFNSSSWKVTRPLRVIRRLLRGDIRDVFSQIRLRLFEMARRVFGVLPLGLARKIQLQGIAFRFAGPLFVGTASYELWRNRVKPNELKPLALGVVDESSISEQISKIDIKKSADPLVTVIIPTFGNLGMTLTCLRSIHLHQPVVGIEVVVVEDASNDVQIDRIAEIRGIRYKKNIKNLGFIKSCNAASREAKGSFIFLLNNDTEVTAGWLDRLVEVFNRKQDAGLVGSKLIYPDGRLQEAGGIIWSDGSGWNYGRLNDPSRSEFSYLKEVDYCSGAAILIRRSLFEKLGYFDEQFVPAYFEDSDLAFKVRAEGLKVYCEPASVVIHYEGVSNGTDLNSGVKAHQLINHEKFVRKWSKELKSQSAPGTNVFSARERSSNRSTIVIVDHYVPQPDKDAGSRTIVSFIRSLLRLNYNVKFWPDNLSFDPIYCPLLQSVGVEVIYGLNYEDKFEEWLISSNGVIDAVLISRPHIAKKYFDVLKGFPNIRKLFYGHDLHFQRLVRQYELTGDSRQLEMAEAIKLQEMQAWSSSDVVLYPSAEEANQVKAIDPKIDARSITPYAFDDNVFNTNRTVTQGRSVVFVAGFAHPPNIDAAIWFVTEILPEVLRQMPGTMCFLVGSNPPQKVSDLQSASVCVTGYVSDLRLAQYYEDARVAVVPLRYGAGVKSKVVEALAYGVPLVTTPVGAQGLDIRASIPITDDPLAFANYVVKLLKEDSYWRQVSTAGVNFAREHYSWSSIERDLLATLT
jgi:O-antigen biosynthesis protein